MHRPPHRLCGPAAGGTDCGVSVSFAMPTGTIDAMSTRIALAVYFLVAAAAGFVTASRNLPFPLLLLVLLALAIVAVLVRQQVIGAGGMTRVSVAFIGVYIAAFFVTLLLFGR